MVYDALEDPPRPTHQEILERAGYSKSCLNVLYRYHRIIEIGLEGISIRLFLDGFEARDVVDAISAEVRTTL